MSFNILVATSLAYVVFLFGVAFFAEHRSRQGGRNWLRSPLIYTLSLSIYCTAWTFYGAVGYAARSGLEFVTIYLGPTLLFIGWWWVLRKLVLIGRRHHITSLADLISSRFGKSNSLGVLVTVIAMIVVTPYIALQLQSVVQAFDVFASHNTSPHSTPESRHIAMWVAAGLALFTVVFGTRHLDAKEQHTGIVTAIAVEAVVKLVALMAVGIYVLIVLAPLRDSGAGGLEDLPDLAPGRFTTLIFLSAAAVIGLPRMFQVMVVENTDDAQLARASWAFPAYLLVMSLFIIPIALVGRAHMPSDANPDMFVLTVPLAQGQGGLALLAFLGGFSSATSMVIVEAMALATMVSNHIVIPSWLRLRRAGAISEDVRALVLNARRISVGVVLLLAYGYHQISGGTGALAAIGLISFAGVAQFLPAVIGGIFWQGATRAGAISGLCLGFAVWAYALFLPSFGTTVMGRDILESGLWGVQALRPHALFATAAGDPLVHAVWWSLGLNLAAFCGVSLVSRAGALERVQANSFVAVFDNPTGPQRWAERGGAEPEALLEMSQRILGLDVALALFERAARAQGKRESLLPEATPDFLAELEQKLAGTIGTATAHALIANLVGRETVTVPQLLALARESAARLEQTVQLEEQRSALARSATALHEANEKLTAISVQKDEFLSHISHELRTPMTSIRAFSEILSAGDLAPDMVARSGTIIRDEAVRLTRLLDDLLDLSVLESGKVQLSLRPTRLSEVIDRAIMATEQIRPDAQIAFSRSPMAEELRLVSDPDRLTQVFINLIANARKYCDAPRPIIRIDVRLRGLNTVQIDLADNGPGIPKAARSVMFEKFWRLPGEARASGAGLGLAICREIVQNLGGTIAYLPGQSGAAYRIKLPRDLRKTVNDKKYLTDLTAR